MTTTETPPARSAELHEVPVLVIQLKDDLSRSRLREAFWISVIVHLLLVIAVMTSPRWIRLSQPIAVRTAQDVIRDKELTYLELPRDTQKVEKPRQTDIISDKDRIASSRHPTLDRRTLEKLRSAAPPGAPGPAAPPGMRGQREQPQAAQRPPAATAPPAISPPAATTAGQPQTMARVEPPQAANPFRVPASPGTAIEQAARAAANSRVGGLGGGEVGEYGLAPPRANGIQSNLDILSDTMGVDFGPYLSRVLHDVRQSWYVLIPEVARAPLMKRGKVSIEFAILRDGKVSGMRLTGPSGDISLDRAAWGGITNSNPFPPLPGEFRGSYLALRFHFYYNPDRSDLR